MYSPVFNARHVSLTNIVNSSRAGSPSMKATAFADGDSSSGKYLGFNTTEMGVVLYSLHSFGERVTSYHDLLRECRSVGGQPLSTIHKVCMEHDNGNTEHFSLFCDDMCAVPVTQDAFNALRCFLGYPSDIKGSPSLTDIQTVLAGLAGLDLSTAAAYQSFCDERQIPFPFPVLPDNSELPHATVCSAFSNLYRRHVNVYVACFEGNHRFYTCSTLREGWQPTASIPLKKAYKTDGEIVSVPSNSRLNVDVTLQIAVPLPGEKYLFDHEFKTALHELSQNTLRASNTVIRPTFKSFMDTFLKAFQDCVDSTNPMQYLNIGAYLKEDYSVTAGKPDSYIKYRKAAVKLVIRKAVRSDPFLEQAFKQFKGDSITPKTMKNVLFKDFTSTYGDPLSLVRNHRPYPAIVRIMAHFLFFVMFAEENVVCLENYMEACLFQTVQSENSVDIHDLDWMRRYIIETSLRVSLGLREKLEKAPGWGKLRRTNSTKTFRPATRKVLLLVHSNFLTSLMYAVAKLGPSPVIDFSKNKLLGKAVE